MSWLGRAVDAGIDGIGLFKGARDLVEPLRHRGMRPDQITDRLIKTQCGHAAVQGAATSVGGLATAAIGAPIGLAGSLLVQARLAAAIAYAHGHDLADLTVRDRIEAVVSGAPENAAVKSTGITAGKRAAGYLVPQVQKRAAARMLSRQAAGKSAGVISSRLASAGAAKIVPVVGAAVGGAFDLITTKRVADRAKRAFIGGSTTLDVIDGELVDDVG